MEKMIKFIGIKGKNKRIVCSIYENQESKLKTFRLTTKRLECFKTRNIIKTDNLYTIETMYLIFHILTEYFTNTEILNKLLLRELNDIGEFKGEKNF